MLSGHLDGLTTSGYIEGWAFDARAPSRPCKVSVRTPDGSEVAAGLAHLYREDLAKSGIGLGWCAFRLRVMQQVRSLRSATCALHDRVTGAEICRVQRLTYTEDFDRLITTAEAVVHEDPTILRDISQLRGCGELFSKFIKKRGVAAFVHNAYFYVLNRAADQTGQSLYGGLIRRSAIPPFELLAILADSDEFRSRARSLSAPNTPNFPFHCD